MSTKRLLIIIPIFVLLFLLQSYFWVPTYEQQTKGNPTRLTEYITASIGDAALLNPILSADSASSQIESLVFEGLIDRDEDLRFRGRLATSWEVFEEAYFYVNDASPVPGHGWMGPEEIVHLINRAREKADHADAELAFSLNNIRETAIIPSKEWQVPWQGKQGPEEGKKNGPSIRVAAPARIKLTLETVDQNLFSNLTQLLGQDYFSSFSGARYLYATPNLSEKDRAPFAEKLLPATEHNPVLVFHLRPEVKFHDGHVFDASDVKFTFDAIMNPKNLSPRIADYEPVKAVEVMDPLTVRIVYKRLYSPAIGTWGMGVLPEHLLNEDALKKEATDLNKDPEAFSMRQSRFNRKPIGCGPFIFEEWKADQMITLDRFEGYWEGPANYKRYVYRIIPNPLTQEMEFYAGTVDNYAVQPHQVKRLKTDPTYQSFSGTSFGYTYIGYNLRRKPFDDPRVRTALGMAIDIKKIIDYVLYAQGEKITGPFVKQTDFYNHQIDPLPYDPEGALTLLEQAGWRRNAVGWLEKDGKKLQFTLITNSGNDLRKAVLAIAQDAWKKIGIDVRTDLLEWAVFIQERVNKLDFDALVLGWSMGIEPDLFQIWHSSQTGPNMLNFVGFKNQEADDLIVRIRREYDHQKQAAFCHQLHEIISREQPYTFLYVSKWTAVLDKRIVIGETGTGGEVHYKMITPTKTGNYSFHFNKWIKLQNPPSFEMDG